MAKHIHVHIHDVKLPIVFQGSSGDTTTVWRNDRKIGTIQSVYNSKTGYSDFVAREGGLAAGKYSSLEEAKNYFRNTYGKY